MGTRLTPRHHQQQHIRTDFRIIQMNRNISEDNIMIYFIFADTLLLHWTFNELICFSQEAESFSMDVGLTISHCTGGPTIIPIEPYWKCNTFTREAQQPGLRQGGGEGGGRRWEESRGRTCEKDKREIYVGSESLPLAEQLPGINRNGIRPWRRALA